MDDSPFLQAESKWIWIQQFDDAAAKGQFVNLRKTFHLSDSELPTTEIPLFVSADTRYRIFLNGRSISFGPAKSYLDRWYYETVANIAPFLKPGVNVLTARVLRFSHSHDGCLSMIRSPLPGFILSCRIGDRNVSSDRSWKGCLDAATSLTPDEEWDYRLGPQFLSLNENVDGRRLQIGWHSAEFDDSGWPAAVFALPQRKMSPVLDPWRLTPRQIPALPEIQSRFDGVVRCSDMASLDAWKRLLRGESSVVIPGNSSQWVEIEANILTTGFLDTAFEIEGDHEAEQAPKASILCSECYETPMEGIPGRQKGNRTDSEHGKLYGTTDTYILHHGSNFYSPFWFRTFRYVRLTIDASLCSAPVKVTALTYRSTHYPLEIHTRIETPDVLLRNEDCPFYEQNQFAMDTRSMILFTYALSRDDRLPRKAIQEFYASRMDDGLVQTHYPCPGRGGKIIPTFSLFWVLMIYDHMQFFGDEALVRKYAAAVDDVLHYFHTNINTETGLVGSFGADTWAFVDWANGWATPEKGFLGLAIPPAYYRTGSATYHTLVYAYVLAKASELFVFLERHDTAREYLRRQNALVQAVRKHCFDAQTGFFLDGPGATGELSQHSQVWAVLAGCVEGDDAKVLLRRTIMQCEEHGLVKASLAQGFYVFRAASLAGVYDECWDTLIQPWKRMIASQMTTWAESESMVRSDCHGWSATPIWEIVTEILGVQASSKEYIQRVVHAKSAKESVVTSQTPLCRFAPRPSIARGPVSAEVVAGLTPKETVGVKIDPEAMEVHISGSAEAINGGSQDGAWTIRYVH